MTAGQIGATVRADTISIRLSKSLHTCPYASLAARHVRKAVVEHTITRLFAEATFIGSCILLSWFVGAMASLPDLGTEQQEKLP